MGRMKAVIGLRRGASSALALVLASGGWAGAAPSPASAQGAGASAESYMVVDCLLPGQVRKLGRTTTFLTPRRPVRTSGVNCEIRGGEYVAADRATFESSLGVWLPSAQTGDPKAQDYVGHIYADGFGHPPDFAQAAVWYQKASDQGYSPATIELGQLYERGQGVPRDSAKAVDLYRKASGLPPADLASAQAATGALTAKYEAARADAQAMSRELAAAQADLAQERAALAKARDALAKAGHAPAASTSGEAEALRRQLADRTAELEAAKAQSAELSNAVRAAQAHAQTQADQKAGPLSAQVKADQAERATMLKQRDAMEQQLAALRQQLPDQQGRVAFLEADAAQARKLGEAANARLAQTLTDLHAREGELATAQKRLAGVQSDAAAHAGDAQAAARLRTTQADYDRLSHDLEQARADAAARQAEIAAIGRASQTREADLAKARTEADAAQARLAKAQTDLGARDAQLQQVAARLAAAEGRTAEVQRQYEAANERSTALAGQVADLQRQVAGAKSGDSAAAKALAAREAALAEREARIKALETRLASTRNAPTPGPAPVRSPSRLQASSQFGFNQNFAILIGEADYQDPKLPRLATPINDVQKLGALLQSRYGFNVTLLVDKSRTDILRELDDLAQKLNEKDTLLIYYAGHGGMEKVRNGADRGYWLPVDAEAGHSAGQISNQEITYQVARMAARKVLIIADSCYSGLLTQTVTNAQRPPDAAENSNDYLIGMAHKPSRNVLTSGRLEPVLDGGGGDNHSVFAQALIQILQSNSDVITSAEIYHRLLPRVMATATGLLLSDKDNPDPQQPTYAALENGGHVFGDFLFVPKQALAARAPRAPGQVAAANGPAGPSGR
jgi:hypothetical protein